jgi:tRNA-dihydrouridine synthase B
MQQDSPLFQIGEIPIHGNAILAPMDGYSDSPFRRICRKYGSALSYTEFINAIDVVQRIPYLEVRTTFIEEERPIGFQVFDNDPERLKTAVLILKEKNPDFFDINFGCSIKRVVNRGAGAALLKEPRKIGVIINSLSKCLDIPVTAKIRLGWEHGQENYLEVAKIIEDNGAKAIAVHGRTRDQALKGEADWDAISKIKSCSHIPVIGNGDIKNIQDMAERMKSSGCDAVMIGRAAIGNPWIFSNIEKSSIENNVLLNQIIEHLQLMSQLFGERRAVIRFRKHLTKYLQHRGLDKREISSLLKIPNSFSLELTLNDLLTK